MLTDENTAVTIKGLSVSDPDGGSSVEKLTLSVSHGTISFAGHTGTSITISGTLAQLNADLAAGARALGEEHEPARNERGSRFGRRR